MKDVMRYFRFANKIGRALSLPVLLGVDGVGRGGGDPPASAVEGITAADSGGA